MREKEKCRKGNVQYFCMYTAGFLAVALLLLLIFAKEHASFTKMADGVAQHYAVLMWIRNTLRQFLHGNFALPMVDFSVGQGFDVIGTLNYYGVGDPVNLLTVFFADNHLDQMYMFLILFRMYLSGLTFSYYCSTAGIQRKASVLCGSWLYVFCSFALIGGMKHPLFLNGMLYLPLLLAGTEKVLQKKSIRFLSVSVALAFMSNYYFMYMNTILCGIYLCVRLFGHYREYGIRKILLLILKMAAAWIWGICLGAVIILPSVYAFLHNARVDTAVEEAQNFYSIAHYRKMILGFFQTLPMTNGWTVHGTAIGGLAGVLMLFTSKKRSRENCQLKIGFVVLLVLLCIPFGGKMMNGFAYVTNRWSYGMAFLCALMAAQAVADLKEQNTKIFLILGAAAGILAAALSASNGKAMRYAIAALAVTVLTFALGAKAEKKTGRMSGVFRCVCRCLLQSHHLLYTGRIFLCRTFYKKRRVGVRVTEPCRKKCTECKACGRRILPCGTAVFSVQPFAGIQSEYNRILLQRDSKIHERSLRFSWNGRIRTPECISRIGKQADPEKYALCEVSVR